MGIFEARDGDYYKTSEGADAIFESRGGKYYGAIRAEQAPPGARLATDWHIPQMTDMVFRRGSTCDIYSVQACPCLIERSEEVDDACIYCWGSGEIINVKFTTEAIISGSGNDTERQSDLGLWEQGDAVVTVKENVDIGEGFRFVFPVVGMANRYSEVIRKDRRRVREPLHFNFGVTLNKALHIKRDLMEQIQDIDMRIRSGELTEKADLEALNTRRRVLLGGTLVDMTNDVSIVTDKGVAFLEWQDDELDDGEGVSVDYFHYLEYVAYGQLEDHDFDADSEIVQRIKVSRRDTFLNKFTMENAEEVISENPNGPLGP